MRKILVNSRSHVWVKSVNLIWDTFHRKHISKVQFFEVLSICQQKTWSFILTNIYRYTVLGVL